MANMIQFLRGNVASLPANAIEGAVYFTKDEGLYLGLADGTYHRYGDFIEVANVDALPADGANKKAMYYCTEQNILAKWDGTQWVQINKQKTLAELGGVAKAVYEAKVAALEAKDTAIEKQLSGFSADEGSVKTYVDNAIASVDAAGVSSKITALENADVTINERIDGVISTHGTDKAALEGAIALKADKSAHDELAGKVTTIETSLAEGGTIASAIADAKNQADKGVADASTAQSRADDAYALAESKATMDQVNSAISNAGHAVKSEVDQTIADMDAAYKKADSDMQADLEGKINAKVAQSVYDAKVAELVAEDERLAGLISDMDTAYKAADESLGQRIATLEGDITGLSGAMHFKGIVETLPETTEGYSNGDVVIYGNKEYVVNGANFVELGDVSAEVQRITDLEGVVNGTGEGDNHVDGLVDKVADNTAAIAAEKARAEAKEAELAGADATNLQAAKDYADEKIQDLKISEYAKQADLEAHTNDTDIHVTTADKEKWNSAQANAEATAAAALKGHTDNGDIHVTTADKEKWNSAEQNAKGYADGKFEEKGVAQGLVDGLATGAVKTNTDAIAIINGDVNTAGSFKAADKVLSDKIDVINGSGDGSFAKADAALKTTLEGYADQAEADAIATAKEYTDLVLTWGTF